MGLDTPMGQVPFNQHDQYVAIHGHYVHLDGYYHNQKS
jgi:ssRNA-specific RNase YbeY (16S rRNA maturation enzyme)